MKTIPKLILPKILPKNHFDILEELSSFKMPYEEPLSISENILDIETTFNREDSIIIQGVNAIFSYALESRATDIHIEPCEDTIRIRYRIDGFLLEKKTLNKSTLNAIISRLKFLTNLDISERRLPQDGRMKANFNNRNIDFRVSTVPTIYGEKIVIRILDKTSTNLSLDKMGFEKDQYDTITKFSNLSSGLILVTGPTGSGKSTTLYSILNQISSQNTNISTIEDPVEYNISNVNQIQIKPDIGLNFSNILRQLLRQDPDIIMVGEIRDSETAELTIKSALTGHLIFSTLHTNDAINSISRLKNLGIDNYLIANTLKLIISQRLIRKLCDNCKIIDTNIPEKLLFMIPDKISLYSNSSFYKKSEKGCHLCDFMGYKGRLPILELITVTPPLKSLIENNKQISELINYLSISNHTFLLESGVKKASEGVVSLDDLIKAI